MTAAACALVHHAFPPPPHSARERGFADWLAQCRAAFTAPLHIRVLGGSGSGHEPLAAALAATEPQWLISTADIDASVPTVVPDVEVLTLCTAPCAHESAWWRRPRRHNALLVVTNQQRWQAADQTDTSTNSAVTTESTAISAGTLRSAAPDWTHGAIAVDDPWVDTGPHVLAVSELTAEIRALEHRIQRARIATAVMRLERDCDALGCRESAENLIADLALLLEEKA